MKKEEAASQLTPLEIPTRPKTLVETPMSQALDALKENPQITPETLAQEITPTMQIPHTEAQPSTEIPAEEREDIQAGEGQVGDDEQSTGAGDEDERNLAEGDMDKEDSEAEKAEGEEVEKAEASESEGEGVEKDEASESEGEEVEKAEASESDGEEVEKAEGSEAEGREIDAEGEGVETQEEEGEKDDRAHESEEEGGSERESENVSEGDEKAVESEEEPEKVEEEKQESGDLNAEKETETEVVVIDNFPSDDKGTPTDERTSRRHSRRVKSTEEIATASQPQVLRLRDEEDSEDDIPQVQENPASTEDVSPAVLVERYEAERKRKGKQEAKPHKKKPRQASRAVVIDEPTPETIRVPFAAAAGEEASWKDRKKRPKTLRRRKERMRRWRSW